MIDYSKVITREQIMALESDKYNFIRNEAKLQSEKIKYKVNFQLRYKNKIYYYYIDTQRFANDVRAKGYYLNEDQIALIEANIVIFSSKMLIDILLNNKITYNSLLKTIIQIKNLKILQELNEKLQKLLQTNITDKQLKLLRLIIQRLTRESYKADNNLNKICRLIQYYYSFDKYELIVNRLVQTVVFDRELYKNMEEKRKKRQNKDTSLKMKL